MVVEAVAVAELLPQQRPSTFAEVALVAFHSKTFRLNQAEGMVSVVVVAKSPCPRCHVVKTSSTLEELAGPKLQTWLPERVVAEGVAWAYHCRRVSAYRWLRLVGKVAGRMVAAAVRLVIVGVVLDVAAVASSFAAAAIAPSTLAAGPFEASVVVVVADVVDEAVGCVVEPLARAVVAYPVVKSRPETRHDHRRLAPSANVPHAIDWGSVTASKSWPA